ncbi:acyltransferase [Chamaesiphon sp. OTE_20_metabat_361]|uniref:acyltransferase family protein n=1 Tax=Chamaesiphon sp. OTE_20_metabat_361 TaxID=2964689 RepID=UPI00286C610D|nr:acyltransferase [Chamaesiphon sp. OTE_20_metabat_361]
MKKQLNSLQLYRGIASILVVLHHANIILDRELKQDGLFNVFHFGWMGVDFFFVLSGFIIFYIHQADLSQSSQFKSFVRKRCLRVYPFYWILLAVKILGSLAIERDGSFDGVNLWQFIQVVLLVPQAGTNLTPFIGVAWTLTYEIFFYAIFSLLILCKPQIYLLPLAVWIVGIVLNLVNVLPIGGSVLLEFIFNTHNLEFVFGCLAAYIVSTHRYEYKKMWIYLALAMLVGAIINTGYRQFDVAGLSPVIAYGIPCTILIVGSVQVENQTVLKLPSSIIYLGNASYSIYLTHGLFMNTIAKVYLKISEKLAPALLDSQIVMPLVATAIVGMSIALGCIIHDRVEKPLLKILNNKPATAV